MADLSSQRASISTLLEEFGTSAESAAAFYFLLMAVINHDFEEHPLPEGVAVADEDVEAAAARSARIDAAIDGAPACECALIPYVTEEEYVDAVRVIGLADAYGRAEFLVSARLANFTLYEMQRIVGAEVSTEDFETLCEIFDAQTWDDVVDIATGYAAEHVADVREA